MSTGVTMPALTFQSRARVPMLALTFQSRRMIPKVAMLASLSSSDR
jgi:hypothetical protein